MAYVIDETVSATDFEEIAVSATPVGLTASILTVIDATKQPVDIRRVKKVALSVELDNIRFRVDGVDPTPSTGHELRPGDAIDIAGFSNLTKIRFIRSGISDAAICVTYFH